MEISTLEGTKKEDRYFLTDLLDLRVSGRLGRLGRLADLVAEGKGSASVTHLVVKRPYNDNGLLVPWNRVAHAGSKEVVLEVGAPDEYEAEAPADALLLREHVLDRKALRLNDVSPLYVNDLLLISSDVGLTISKADLSRGGRRRLIGLGGKRSENELTPWSDIQPIPPNLGRSDRERVAALKGAMRGMRPVDIAILLGELDRDQRRVLFELLDVGVASDVLEEIGPDYQRELITSLDQGRATKLLDQMTPGQAADVLSSMPRADSGPILDSLDPRLSAKARHILGRQEDQAVYYATPRVIKVHPDHTIEMTRNNYPALAEDREVAVYLYVVGDSGELLGVLDTKELLRAPGASRVREAMTTRLITLRADATLKEAADLIARYEFQALPVVDENGAFLGALLYRDIAKIALNIAE